MKARQDRVATRPVCPSEVLNELRLQSGEFASRRHSQRARGFHCVHQRRRDRERCGDHAHGRGFSLGVVNIDTGRGDHRQRNVMSVRAQRRSMSLKDTGGA